MTTMLPMIAILAVRMGVIIIIPILIAPLPHSNLVVVAPTITIIITLANAQSRMVTFKVSKKQRNTHKLHSLIKPYHSPLIVPLVPFQREN